MTALETALTAAVVVFALGLLLLLLLWVGARRRDRRIEQRRPEDTQEIPVAELMNDLNDALKQDFESRREVYGRTVPELMDERAARERAAFDGIIRASWPTDN